MSDVLTVGGFVALITLLLGVVATVVGILGRLSGLAERLATLEEKVRGHLENGARHG